MNTIWLSVVTMVGLVFLTPLSKAAAEDFYKGKTIRFIVGFAAGGGYDTYTRAVARHIVKHIPGNPSTVVENMDGAGSLIGANHVYNKAEPDGLTAGNWNSALVLREALGDKGIRFKSDKFDWVGAPSVGLPTCTVMGFTGLKTLADVLKTKRRLKMGGTRSGTTNDLPPILNRTLGTNLEVIPGYKGTATIRVAMQRREVDGACWGWESIRVTARSMLDSSGDDKLIPFITHGKSEDPEVKRLPRLRETVKAGAGEEGLAIVNAWLAQYDFQRPLMFPPGTPRDRLNILRKALKATLEDPEFLAEAKKTKLIITYVPGEDIEKFVNQILAITPKAKEALQFLVTPAKKK